MLETALLGVCTVAIYVIPKALIWYGHRMIRHRYITLPNLVLGREVVPELLQEAATPQRLAETLDALMRDPARQYADFVELRAALGPADALQRCAQYAVEVARTLVIRIYHTSDLHDHRGIAAPLRRLRDGAPGPALRLRRLVARKSEPLFSQRADDGGARCGRLRRASDRQSRVSLPLRALAGARGQDAPPAGLYEFAGRKGPSVAVRAFAAVYGRRSGRTGQNPRARPA